jgi:hypothetical protein
VTVDNPDFQIATDLFQQPSTSSLMPYLDTEFYYTLLIGGDLSFANYYTISQIDDKVAVLQLGIDSTYTKVQSDNKYRTIADSYSKTELDTKTLGYDLANNWHTLDRRLLIRANNLA